jgi:TPR repeat protein
VRLVLALLVVGCRGSHPEGAPAHAGSDVHAAPRFDAAVAERYERGDGVARDFRAAAKLYADACHAGCGDLIACHGLLELAIANRGVTPTLADLPIAARMCKRGDATACISLGVFPFDKRVAIPEELPCKPGDHIGCEAAMWMDDRPSFGPHDEPPEPPTADELRHDMTGPAAQLCTEGVADGCIHLVGQCTDRACIDRRAAYLQDAGVDAAPLLAAWQAVDVACNTGDVDACESAGRPLPKAELCAAGDEEACGHDRIAIIKAMQAEVATLVTSCRANDHAACYRLAWLTSADCH